MMDDVADEENNGAGGSPATADPGKVFAALAEIIYQGSEANEVYAAICVAATLVVTGCDHASLLVRRDGRYVTVGASDRIAQRIDDLERIGRGRTMCRRDRRRDPADRNRPHHAEPMAEAGRPPGRRDPRARGDGLSHPG